MDTKRAIVNVSSGAHFLRGQKRLYDGLDRHDPASERIFWNKIPADWPQHIDRPPGVVPAFDCLEGYEFKEMYPAFIDVAEKEGNRAAVVSFRNANAVEEIHHGLYTKALETLAGGKDLPAASIHVCEVCGNTVVGDAPDKCPICGASKAKFKEVP